VKDLGKTDWDLVNRRIEEYADQMERDGNPEGLLIALAVAATMAKRINLNATLEEFVDLARSAWQSLQTHIISHAPKGVGQA
jgi:hypothetical protein